MVNNFLFLCVCVCVLLVTWRANGIVLYMYEGKVLMDIAFLDIAREGQRGATNNRRGRFTRASVLRTYSRKERTGHNNKSSGRPAAKSPREGTEKERGRERTTDSVFAKNSGTYEIPAAEDEKDTARERACNSPTRLALANAKRNKVFLDKSRKEDSCNGSKTGERK